MLRCAVKGCALSLLLATAVRAQGDVSFQEVAGISGVHYSGRSFGVSTGDFNNDGWPDVWVGNHRNLARLYQNNGDGTFTDIIPGRWADPLTPDGHGAAFADFDNDNDQDIIQLVGADGGTGEGPNVFLVNENGRLVDQAASANLAYEDGRGRTPAWIDWNNDGLLDLFVSNTRRGDGLGDSILFEANGGPFQPQAGVHDDGGGLYSQISDLLDDGSQYMLLQSRFGYPGKVYRLGDNPASDLTRQLQIPQYSGVGDTTIGDFDGDLRPDIFMARLDSSASEVLQQGRQIKSRLLVEGGERGFSFKSNGTITVSAQPSWVINRNQVFIGAGGAHPSGLTFTLNLEDSAVHGIANHAPGVDNGLYVGYDQRNASWEVRVSDRGRQDVNVWVRSNAAITALSSPDVNNNKLRLKDVLLLNKPGGFVVNPPWQLPGSNSACESVGSGDFDNDMDLDIYLVCRTQTINEANWLLLNDGAGLFRRVPAASGAEGANRGRGDSVSVLDYNADGFLDLFVTNGNGEEPFTDGPYQLFRNSGNGNNWLQFDLRGNQSNRDGIGARLVISTPDGKSQLRERNGGYHRSSQDYMRVHAGLARNQTADVRIEWPSGVVDTFTNVQANGVYVANEGGALDRLSLAPVDPYECVMPEIDNDADSAVLIWKNCVTGRWALHAGGGADTASFEGAIFVDSSAISQPDDWSIEDSDVLVKTASKVEFSLETVAGGFDGFYFNLDESAPACLDFRSSKRVDILIGGKRYSHRVPFDLNALGACEGLNNAAPPVLFSIADQANDTDDAVNLQVNVRDADGDWPYFSAVNLPMGLDIGSNDGLISGTPEAAGDYSVTVIADDGRGRSDSAQFNWVVTEGTSPPPPPPPPPPTPQPNGNGGGGGGTTLWFVLLMLPAAWRRFGKDVSGKKIAADCVSAR